MKVSVCIPCDISHIAYLPDCIKNISYQISLPDEVVISLSNVNKTIDEYIEKIEASICCRTKLIITAEKKYAGENRNIAVENSSGDVIVFIDADDYMHPSKIQIVRHVFQDAACHILLHYFEENVGFHPTTRDFEDDSAGHDVPVEPQDKVLQYEYTDKLHFGHGTFRRSVFDTQKYTAKPRGQDVEFIHNLLPTHRKYMFIYEAPLTYYMSNRSTYYR